MFTPSRTIIAVPARNEAERLPRLVRALDRQGAQACLLVLLNGCTDGSRARLDAACASARNVELHVRETVLPPSLANAGVARRLALDAALDVLLGAGVPLDAAALLTTDADAEPAPDWLRANLAALNAGADLVGGRIHGAPEEEALLPPLVQTRARALLAFQDRMTRIESALDPVPHDPWPRHRDTLGASLGVRAATYRAIGGLPPRAAQEDLALAEEVRLHGGLVRRCPAVCVTVSARTRGRAAGGMADTLTAWIGDAEAGRPLLIEHPRDTIARFMRRAALRRLYSHAAEGDGLGDSVPVASRELGFTPRQLAEAFATSASADAFVTRLVPETSAPRRTLPLPRAARLVEAWLRTVDADVMAEGTPAKGQTLSDAPDPRSVA